MVGPVPPQGPGWADRRVQGLGFLGQVRRREQKSWEEGKPRLAP